MQSHTDVKYQQITLANQPITVKRIDLVHPTISGNKYYKLKYNLQYAKEQGYSQILSFGGAYSNHIHALAHASHEFGFESIGIIRGQELANKPLNPTLSTAKSLGMELHFITRQAYRQKDSIEYLQELRRQYPNAYIIPEGGTNALAVKGCEEILSTSDIADFDVICCAVGTGGAISGIINSLQSLHSSLKHTQVIGISALNTDYQRQEIEKWVASTNPKNQQVDWQLLKDGYFGGYGKSNEELLQFIEQIKVNYALTLEPIYTGKALFYLWKMLQDGKILSNKKVLFIHTGGLQGLS